MTQDEYLRQLSHASVLISQSKFVQAEERLSQMMNQGHTEPELLKMIAICKLGQLKFHEAKPLMDNYLQQMPNDPHAFYILANIHLSERGLSIALDNINEAIRLDSAVPEFFALQSNIFIQLKDYEKALRSADIGLNLDAQDISCLNARSTALVLLDRKDEAYETINKSLAEDPNNPDTHANMGWGLLHRGKSNEALVHFKAALMEDPMHDYAKSGMLQAMKSRFPLYRYFLVMMLKLGKLTGKNQWTFIIGSYVCYRLLIYLAREHESMRPLIIPLVIILLLFFLSSWLFSPLMNLYMLTNPYGRYTMDRDEQQSARLVGISLSLSVLALVMYIFIPNEGLLVLSLSAFLLMIPLGSMNNAFKKSNRIKLRNFTSLLAILMLINVIISITQNSMTQGFSIITLTCFVAYQWYTNYVLIKE